MFRSTPVFFILMILALPQANGAHFDPPDKNLERNLHHQYLMSQKATATTSVEGLSSSSAGQTVEDYRLQAGENLWQLSEMLYGDGGYWPKVWAQNKNITNPHLVRRGHTLQFRMGSEDQLPAFRFSEDGDPGRGLELAAATDEEAQIEIPPPEEPPKPLIKVPRSFPTWQNVFRKLPDDFKTDFSGIKPSIRKMSETIYLTGYAQEKELMSVGSYLETEGQSALPVEMQYVYVKMKPGAGQLGSTYLIVRDMGRLERSNDLVEDRVKAHLIRVYGEIELTDRIPDKNRESSQSEVFRALVTKAIDLTMTDFSLIPGRIQQVTINQNGPLGNVSTQIIGSYKSTASVLFGPGDIVFLNKGSQSGITHGQILNIFTNRIGRNRETHITNSLVSSGVVKIVKVDEHVSTAVIVYSNDGLQQGDYVQTHANAFALDPAKDTDEYDPYEADGLTDDSQDVPPDSEGDDFGDEMLE